VNVEERSWFSEALGQDMALKVYGHAGRPVVAFPSQDGRYWDFESWGMVEACSAFIEANWIGMRPRSLVAEDRDATKA